MSKKVKIKFYVNREVKKVFYQKSKDGRQQQVLDLTVTPLTVTIRAVTVHRTTLNREC